MCKWVHEQNVDVLEQIQADSGGSGGQESPTVKRSEISQVPTAKRTEISQVPNVKRTDVTQGPMGILDEIDKFEIAQHKLLDEIVCAGAKLQKRFELNKSYFN